MLTKVNILLYYELIEFRQTFHISFLLNLFNIFHYSEPRFPNGSYFNVFLPNVRGISRFQLCDTRHAYLVPSDKRYQVKRTKLLWMR